MRTIDNNGTPLFVADEEYTRWSQIFNRERELISRMMGIPQVHFTEARGNITESNSERYRWVLAGPALPNECYSREENIPCWNGKILEKVEVFQ